MNIYVGNLPFEVTEDQLHVAFTQHGEVTSARVITDRMTGRSRGFGFVEMPNNDEAESAIRALNGQDFHGRPLTVNERGLVRTADAALKAADTAPATRTAVFPAPW